LSLFVAGLELWWYAHTYWFQGNFRLQVVGVFVLFWWVLGGAIVYFRGGSGEVMRTVPEEDQDDYRKPNATGNGTGELPAAAPVTLSTLRSHVHRAAVRLHTVEAALEDLANGDIPPSVLERALTDLAEIAPRLGAVADQLWEADIQGRRGMTPKDACITSTNENPEVSGHESFR
jgi:hypothetical protein